MTHDAKDGPLEAPTDNAFATYYTLLKIFVSGYYYFVYKFYYTLVAANLPTYTYLEDQHKHRDTMNHLYKHHVNIRIWAGYPIL